LAVKVLYSPGSRGGDLSRLNDLIDPIMIEHTLQALGKAANRRCKLTAVHVMWLSSGWPCFAI